MAATAKQTSNPWPKRVDRPRYYGAIGDRIDMYVNDNYLDNVGYVIDGRTLNNPKAIGTVFFVVVQDEGLNSWYLFTGLTDL